MPLPKLKYSKEQLETIRSVLAANGWKKPQSVGQIRAEDLESTLLKGGSAAGARDDRKGRDDRDHHRSRDQDDWGPRTRNRNREAFEEGYDYELQMKAQKKNELEEALKLEESRVAERKRREDVERRKKELQDAEERALQQQEEQGKIYEAQQAFGVAGVDETDTVFAANTKHSRFGFKDLGDDDDEAKPPRPAVAPASSDFLDPFGGVRVSTAVHRPPAAVAASATPNSEASQGVPPQKAASNSSANPPTNKASGDARNRREDKGNQNQQGAASRHHQPSQQNHGQNRGHQQQHTNASTSVAVAQSNAGAHQQLPISAAVNPPANNQPFVDPCIVSMSNDAAPSPAKSSPSSSQAVAQATSSARAQAAPKSETAPSVSALFAGKLNIGSALPPPSNTTTIHGAVDASQLESQLLAKQLPPAATAATQPTNQSTGRPSGGAGVGPQPVAVTPTSPPQQPAPPPPYQPIPLLKNPKTPPVMPMTVGGQQVHVTGHPGFLMMPQGYQPVRPGQPLYYQQYYAMQPPPQGQGRGGY